MHIAAPLMLVDKADEAMDAFDRIWDTDLDDKSHSRVNALRMLTDFASGHTLGQGLYEIREPPQGLIDLGDRKSPYEIPFAMDIGLSIPLVGLIDWFGQYKDRDMVVPVDLKTTSEVSDRLFNSFLRNPQVCAYILAARHMTGDHRIDRMVVDFM